MPARKMVDARTWPFTPDRRGPPPPAPPSCAYCGRRNFRRRIACAKETATGEETAASPDGKDTDGYRAKLPGVKVRAINRAPLPRTNVEKAEMDTVLAEADDASFDVVFYDSTARSVDMK